MQSAAARTDLAAGDVLSVADSLTKRRNLARFTAEFAGADKVDTRDTGFFGRNATGAVLARAAKVCSTAPRSAAPRSATPNPGCPP
ncbi:MAG: hypothetical protein IH993_03630 [Proteobacteria bacterium]|nr:hypothetical protein [Pseudomonadota bacterium]